jgi:putative IMPACT (imprinted ancient) family translation regulator
MSAHATWKAYETHGELSTAKKNDLPESVFAFPKERKEPLTDAEHVQNALARFDQVKGVSDDDRDLAFANIKKAAKHYGVSIIETDWHDLDSKPHTKNKAQ